MRRLRSGAAALAVSAAFFALSVAQARPLEAYGPLQAPERCELNRKAADLGYRWRKPVNIGWVGFDEDAKAFMRGEIDLIADITGLEIAADRSRPVNMLMLSAKSPDQISDRLVGVIGSLSGGEEKGPEIIDRFRKAERIGRRVNYGVNDDIVSAVFFLPRENDSSAFRDKTVEALYASFGAFVTCTPRIAAKDRLNFYRRALFRIYAGAMN